MIKNSSFIKLVTASAANDADDYIGMGNPDSDVLLVGCEKALEVDHEPMRSIWTHEFLLNQQHWADIVRHRAGTDPFDRSLLLRPGKLAGFNPYSPILFAPTASIVKRNGGHTYRGMERLVNAYETRWTVGAPTRLFESVHFTKSIFSRVFITELSDKVALRSADAGFNVKTFLDGLRHRFMSGTASQFYQGFRNVVLYCGRNSKYVGRTGTPERDAILRIFNPGVSHTHLTVHSGIEVYSPPTGARIILCRHFAAGFSAAMAMAVADHMRPS